MPLLIHVQDLRSLLWGGAFVAAAGLLTGAVMQPDLRAPSEIEGPQMQTGFSGERAPVALDAAAAWTSYAGGIPEYVIGTDWLQGRDPAPEPQMELAYEDVGSQFEMPILQATAATDLHDEPAREPPRFPSLTGGIAYAAPDLGAPAVAVEPMDTALDPDSAELTLATPG